ncbi:MBL fold metallo-hydrolase [Halobellus ruber]|uniref:MBL fold metallo-hydrolase n=1 Tax=Halobellus ruber TaxID=2761102 RepID=A0A7J9SGJ0_9EURY|nr:MBL fold metallo-hydrolase [Halobellus ruber]MBB6646074.1 MBL fold metallo-hydrolase [Halobellus ruber]
MSDSDYPEPEGEVDTLSPATLATRIRAGEPVSILDVRDRDEYDAWHVDGPGVTSRQVPYIKFVQAEIKDTVAELAPDLPEPIVVVCGEGKASAYVADLLTTEGVDAANLAGGMDAWAELLVAAAVPTDGPTTVRQYQRPSSGCLSYLVEHDGEAAVVDPLRAFADRYAADAADLDATIAYAVDTHVHADHVSGVRAVADRTDAEVVLPAGAVDRGLEFDARLVDDGGALTVGGATLHALYAPGHTREMTAFAVGGSDPNGDGVGTAAADVLLAGDSLFLRSVARPDLEEGVEGAPELAALLHRTLTDRFAELPDDVRVAPGHYDATTTADESGAYAVTLGDLRGSLNAFSMDSDAFVDHVLSAMPPRPNNYQRIIGTNLGRERVDDAEAFEMELGPNNCAATAVDAD